MAPFDVAKLFDGYTVKPLGVGLQRLRAITSPKSKPEILAVLPTAKKPDFSAFLTDWEDFTKRTWNSITAAAKAVLDKHRATLDLVEEAPAIKAKEQKRKAEEAAKAREKAIADKARQELLAEVRKGF